MAAQATWTDAEVILLLHAETVEALFRAGEPTVTEGRLTSAGGAAKLVEDLSRLRTHFVCSEGGAARRATRRALKALLREFQHDERADLWLREQLEGLGK